IFNLKYLEYVEQIILDYDFRYVYFDQEEDSLSKKYYDNLYDVFTLLYEAFNNLITQKTKLYWSDTIYTHVYRSLFHMVYTAIIIQGKLSFFKTYKVIKEINNSFPADKVVSNAKYKNLTLFMKVNLFL